MNLSSSPTYHTSVEQKLKAKKCALMLKNGSPKLRQVLREVILIILNILHKSNFNMLLRIAALE